MSKESNRNSSKKLKATKARAETGESAIGNSSRDEEIRRRAYEIYLERGEQPGTELADWLQAERELEQVVLSHAQAG
jgi:Protein of unknown function (DUF2934)